MIIQEENIKQKNKEKIKRIFSLLKDVKLPKHYKFIDGCVQIKYSSFFNQFIVANITLEDNDVLEVSFEYEDDYKTLRKYFEESKTKFKLIVREGYYY